jgi:hypothetical protein
MQADLDGDGAADTATLTYDRLVRIYWLSVKTSTGIDYYPFQAAHDARRDRVTMSYRTGKWDYRCRNYIPGKLCGYPVSDGYPSAALFLSDSRNGDFVLMLTFPHLKPNMKPSDGHYVVMPALDGAPMDPP